MRSQLRPALGAGFLFLVAAAAFVALKLRGPDLPPISPELGDIASLYYPLMRYGFGQLRSGVLPLWNPYQWCGEPLLANPSIGFLYPLYIPFLFLPTLQATWLDVLLHLAVAGLAMWALCRHAGMAWGPSAFGGLVYAFHGSMLFKANYQSFLAGVAWMPFIFLFADRLLREPRWRDGGWLAAVLALTLLGGNLQFTYFTLWALVPLVAVRGGLRAWRHGPASLARPFVLLTAAGALGATAALVRLLPGAEFMRHTWRSLGSLEMAMSSIMSIPPRSFLRFLVTPAEPSLYTRVFGEVYVGMLPLALALYGLARWRTQRALALSLALAAAAAAVYAFGSQGFVFPLLFALPGGNWFRGPDRALVVFGLGVAFLGAAGLDHLLRDSGRRAPLAGAVLVPLLAVGLLAALSGHDTTMRAAFTHAAIGTGLLGVLIAWRGHPARCAATVASLGLLIFVDLTQAQWYVRLLPRQTDAYLARHADFFDAIRARQGLDRTYVWGGSRAQSPIQFFPEVTSAGLYHGIWSVTSYAGGVAGRRLEQYMTLLGPPAPSLGHLTFVLSPANVQALHLMGVRFLMVEDGRERTVMQPEVLATLHPLRRARGIALYENPQAFARAFLVRRVEVVRDEAELLARLPGADLRAVAFLEEDLADPLPGAPAAAATAAVTITSYAPNAVTVETSASYPGLLVLTDQYYPGWRVTVDGAPAAVYRADYLFRGVRVPSGRHQVVFRYRPTSMMIGALGSLAGWLAIALVLTRRDARPRER